MADTINEGLSFEEMLDQSFKTLNTGERVTGTVLAVSPAEIKVDLGTKHTGILPKAASTLPRNSMSAIRSRWYASSFRTPKAP